MLTGQSPFSGCDEDELFWSICNERPFIPRYLSQEATDILVCLLEKDSGKRPSGHEIAMHAFFQVIRRDVLDEKDRYIVRNNCSINKYMIDYKEVIRYNRPV